MIRELMTENLTNYKEHFEVLKMELDSERQRLKEIEKTKKLVDKLPSEFVTLNKDLDIDYTRRDEIEDDIKLCKSIIRRYETLLSGLDEE